MSKNLTRKGLALASLVALGASVFAGAPAFAGVDAVSSITLAPNAGTTYTSIIGANFKLKSEIDPALYASGAVDAATNLTFLVGNTAGAALKLSLTSASTADMNGVLIKSADSVDNLSADAVDHNAKGWQNSTDTGDVAATKLSTAAKYVAVKAISADVSDDGSNVLGIQSSTDSTETVTVTVQAFLDTNGNGKIDTFEKYGAVQTVTFLPASLVEATTSITQANVGTGTIIGSVVVGSGVNNANLESGFVKVGFSVAGKVVPLGAGTGNTTKDITDVTYSSTSATLVNALTSVVTSLDAADVIVAGTYVAQAYVNGSTIATATKLGAASSVTGTGAGSASVDGTDRLKVTSIVGSVSATNSATKVALTSLDAVDRKSTTAVKTGYTGAIAFSTTITYNSTDGTDRVLAKKDVPVQVTLTKGSTFDAASSVTAGGVTLTATSGAKSFIVLTSATGAVSFNVAGSGAKNDSVVVTVNAFNGTSYVQNTHTTAAKLQQTVTWADAAPSRVVATNIVTNGAADTAGNVKVAKGASYAVKYAVLDQFGAPVVASATTKYRLDIAPSGNAAFLYNPELSVTGTVDQTIVDNSVATTGYTVTATLSKWTSASASWTQQAQTNTVTVYNNADVASKVTAVGPTDAVSTTAAATAAADLRVEFTGVKTATTLGYDSAVATITGVVTTASGSPVAGQSVTLTAAGLQFVNGSVFAAGSIVVNTDSVGGYSVDVYSASAGTKAIAVAAGAATATVSVKFSGVTAKSETNVLSLDVAALSQVGRAVTVTVKVVDKFGNPVSDIAAAVSVTGVGSLSAATATTDAKGLATVQFLAGANDFGDAVITAKYTATDADATVVSATKTLTVGVTDAQVDIVNNRVTAVSSFTKGRTVSFYVDGVKKWSKLSASDADVVLNYNLKKGTHTVTVKISGGFVTTEKFIVK
jgi:hypothetical protein